MALIINMHQSCELGCTRCCSMRCLFTVAADSVNCLLWANYWLNFETAAVDTLDLTQVFIDSALLGRASHVVCNLGPAIGDRGKDETAVSCVLGSMLLHPSVHAASLTTALAIRNRFKTVLLRVVLECARQLASLEFAAARTRECRLSHVSGTSVLLNSLKVVLRHFDSAKLPTICQIVIVMSRLNTAQRCSRRFVQVNILQLVLFRALSNFLLRVAT